MILWLLLNMVGSCSSWRLAFNDFVGWLGPPEQEPAFSSAESLYVVRNAVDFPAAVGWRSRMSDSPPDDHSGLSKVREGTSIFHALEQIEEALAHLKNTAASDGEPRRVDRASQVRALVETRRLRSDLFSPLLFSDPAWDILLELYVRELEERPVNISRLTAAIPVAATTTLRWIEKLDEEALIRRRDDEQHGRRIWIELSQYGRSLMDRYFTTCSERGLF